MKVALTGATGFVGSHVLPQLLSAGHEVKVLVRNRKRLGDASKVTVVDGDLFDAGAVRQLVRGVDAVVHLVGIIMEKRGQGQTFERVHVEGTQNLVEAAKDAGVKRWVHMSALGTRPEAEASYHLTKWLAEEAVRKAGFETTIFRPSIIHGHDGEFMEMVKQFCCNLLPPAPPFIPYFGTGQTFSDFLWLTKAGLWPFRGVGDVPYVSQCAAGRLQPVFVDDVAKLFADALSNDKSIGEVYPLGGPDAYTWPELYRTCHKHIPGARAKPICAIPPGVAKVMAKLPGMPFNKDQVIMSQEDSVCDTAKVESHFGIELAPFEATLESYAGKIA